MIDQPAAARFGPFGSSTLMPCRWPGALQHRSSWHRYACSVLTRVPCLSLPWVHQFCGAPRSPRPSRRNATPLFYRHQRSALALVASDRRSRLHCRWPDASPIMLLISPLLALSRPSRSIAASASRSVRLRNEVTDHPSPRRSCKDRSNRRMNAVHS